MKGNGMPRGEDVGTQIFLWGFLNVPVLRVRHPDHGEFEVIVDDTGGVPISGACVDLRQGETTTPATKFVIGDVLEAHRNPSAPFDTRWEAIFG